MTLRRIVILSLILLVISSIVFNNIYFNYSINCGSIKESEYELFYIPHKDIVTIVLTVFVGAAITFYLSKRSALDSGKLAYFYKEIDKFQESLVRTIDCSVKYSTNHPNVEKRDLTLSLANHRIFNRAIEKLMENCPSAKSEYSNYLKNFNKMEDCVLGENCDGQRYTEDEIRKIRLYASKAVSFSQATTIHFINAFVKIL